ncbi:MAG TPA: peptide chain release factor N(5)-glutamine methyltransferase [Solirubrobacteraceae bacterium]|nr:peptide chain release factor N(5)-glutamine methyltransferase [Solirubrobacteraceae bacterium]
MSAARTPAGDPGRSAAPTIAEALTAARSLLEAAGCASPRLDAELLLAEVLGVGRERLLLDAGRPLGEADRDRFWSLVARRRRREPVAYILGRRHFRALTLAVDRRALIPRPESELLVEVGLELPTGASVIDVGTGSGAIALALFSERPDLIVGACDVSAGAIALARENARDLRAPIRLWVADLLKDAPALARARGPGADAVLANLPYVPLGDRLMPDVGCYEPALALRGGGDGLDVIRRLIASCAQSAWPSLLALEIDPRQAQTVAGLLADAGFAQVQLRRDLASRERVVVGRRGAALSWGCGPRPAGDGRSRVDERPPGHERPQGDERSACHGRPARAGGVRDERRKSRSQGVAGMSDAGHDPRAAGPSRAPDARPPSYDAERFERCIASGGVAVFPADTVYGLACDPEHPSAVRRMYELKGRPPAKPAAVMFFDRARALEALGELGPRTRAALERLLPGQVTLLVPNPERRFPAACAGDPTTLGVRVPRLPALQQVSTVVMQTSANLAGGRDARTLDQVPESIRAGADLVLDGGELPGTPSTVIDLRDWEDGGRFRVVRVGAVSPEEVAVALSAAAEAPRGRYRFDPET